MDETQYSLTFFGSDGNFEYRYGLFSHVEYAFRTPRLFGRTWTMDGDGWSSDYCFFSEAAVHGSWYITRELD